jgi:DNA repair protein RecO (recombination protein O)
MIKKSEGIILRVTPFSESDAIITIYSKNYGKKSFIIKGGLSKKSKKRVFIKEGYWIEFVFYEKSTREIQKLTDIHLVQYFFNIMNKPLGFCLLLTMIEIFREVIYEEEVPDIELYNFLIQSIQALEKNENMLDIWLNFHEELLAFVGYGKEVQESFQYYSSNTASFIKQAYSIYNKFAKNIEGFKIPKSFEVLKQMYNINAGY